MRSHLKHFVLALSFAMALAACARKPAGGIGGDWLGIRDPGGFPQRLVLHVTVDPIGRLILSLDDLDQGIRDLPADEVALNGDRLSFDVPFNAPYGHSTYKGTVNPAGKMISGLYTWCLASATELHKLWPAYAGMGTELALQPDGSPAGWLRPVLMQEGANAASIDGDLANQRYPIAFQPDLRRAPSCQPSQQTLAGWPGSGSLPFVFNWENEGRGRVKPSEVDGDWAGVLDSRYVTTIWRTSGRLQRLALHVRTIAADKLDVSIDLLDEGGFNPAGAMAIPCADAKLDSKTFSFSVFPSLPLNYKSKLSADSKRLLGTWNLGDLAAAGSRESHFTQGSLDFTREQENPQARIWQGTRVAVSPITLANLKPVFDREFAPVLQQGVLGMGTGGGVVIGVLDHGRRSIFSFGASRPDSIFEIGGITTTFTALALAQMVEQKKVALHEPVRALLPPGAVATPYGPEITLLDLATHHSGLPMVPSNFNAVQPENPFANYNTMRLREFLVEKGVARPPDAKYLWSMTGFGLLGYTLALRAGLSYEQLIKREITGPLHMEDTVITLSSRQRKRLIQGHGPAFDAASPYDFDALAGASALKSTAADLLNYLEANLHPESLVTGAQPGSPSATLPAALVLDHEPRADEGYPNVRTALAWVFNKQADVFFLDGLTGGYTSHLEFNPGHDRAIVVLYNRQDLTPGQMQLVNRIATNINQLMSGAPVIPLDYLSDIDRVTLAYVEHRK